MSETSQSQREEATEAEHDSAQAEHERAEAANETAEEAHDDDRDDGGDLFAPDDRNELEQRWAEIQARFVDEPRGAVEGANALVDDLMNRLMSSFSEERSRLEGQWDRGDDVTTEDLRTVLQKYRAFFGRLLEIRAER
jgi:hypothetical protein